MTVLQTSQPAANRRLAQWLVKWLIEHLSKRQAGSTAHQLLGNTDSFVFPLLRQGQVRNLSMR